MKNVNRALPRRSARRTTGLLVLLLAPLAADAALPSPSAAINFESDAYGAKPAGFSSVATPLAQFTNLGDGALQVGLLGTKAHGRGLIVFRDDGGGLAIAFAQPVNAVSLAFGNDDAAFTSAGDQAQLTLYRGEVQVGSVLVALNRNGVMDQTIEYSGKNFDRAEFLFTNASGTPLKLTEVVDDFAFNLGPTAPPPAPNGLTAVAGDGEATLQWQAVDGASDYTVWRAAADGVYQMLAAALSTTGYTDRTAINGTRYSYRVTANNSAGASGDAIAIIRPLAPLTAADLAAPRISLSSDRFEFRLSGAAGRTYRLQRSLSLAPASWVDAGPAASGAGAELVLTHARDPEEPRQFFRVVIGEEP